MLWVKGQMSSGLFTFQQDGAPAHQSLQSGDGAAAMQTDARLM